MATLSELRDEVRQRVGETNSTFFTDAQINSVLNEGQRAFASEGGIIEADRGFALVKNQYLYDPPSDYINARYLLFEEDTKLRYVTQRELFVHLESDPNQKADPDYWTTWEKQIRVFPVPSTSADSTAIDDGTGISAADVTITVDSTSGFPVSGRIKIDSEEIQYYDTDATSFKQCVRGVAGTTAASHADDAVVDELNLRLFYYKDPKKMAANGDTPDIPTEYHESLIYYATGMLKAKDQDLQASQYFLGLFEEKKLQARDEIKRRHRDRNPRIIPGDHGFRTSQGLP